MEQIWHIRHIWHKGENVLIKKSVKMLTLIELAEYLGVSRWTVYRWISSNKIPVYKIGGVNRFKLDEIDEWLLHFRQN